MSTPKQVVTFSPSDAAARAALPIGLIASILRASRDHDTRPISYIRDILEPAMKHKQLKVFFNERGHPIGFVVWAYLAQDVEDRFLTSGQWSLHESEWREGNIAWIVDFVAPFGHIRPILTDLRDNVFRSIPSIRYYRIKRGTLIAKELDRTSKVTFFLRGKGGT
jgi:hemolysin-activating ACP:hemolysin acyltransferase